MRNYPLCQKISENTHVSTEKEKFPTSFLHFAFFSKLVFCVSKNSFTPLISAISSPIGLKFFLVRLQTIWVGRFFFFWIPCTNQVWQVSQTLGGPKNLEILQSAQYFSSPAWTISNFWKKKRSPRLGPSIYSKNFSSNGWNLWIWQLLLYYSRPIYPENFRNFCSAVSEKRRKGGGPLKAIKIDIKL